MSDAPRNVVATVDGDTAVSCVTAIAYAMLKVQYPSVGAYIHLLGTKLGVAGVCFDCSCVLDKISRKSRYRLGVQAVVTGEVTPPQPFCTGLPYRAPLLP